MGKPGSNPNGLKKLKSMVQYLGWGKLWVSDVHWSMKNL